MNNDRLFAGILKVRLVLVVSRPLIPSIVQPENFFPVAGAFAVIVTLAP